MLMSIDFLYFFCSILMSFPQVLDDNRGKTDYLYSQTEVEIN